MDLQDKLSQLKEKYTGGREDAIAEIEAWEKEVKKALVLTDLTKHAGIKILLEGLKRQREEINDVLLNLRTLTEKDRDILLMKRDNVDWFINLFAFAKSKKETIEQKVDENLEES